MVLFRVISGMFHLHTVMSGWVGGCKCWNMLLMTGRSDRVDTPRYLFLKNGGVFCFSGRNLWKQISVFHSVWNQWSNLCKLKCGRVLKQAYLLLSVCQDLSDTSWLSLQENCIFTANDEQAPTLVWLGTSSLCNEIHYVRFFRALIRCHKNFYCWPAMEFRSGPG